MDAVLDVGVGSCFIRCLGPSAALLSSLSMVFAERLSWVAKDSITRQALFGQHAYICSASSGDVLTPCTNILEYCWSSGATQQGLLTLLANNRDPNEYWRPNGSAGIACGPQAVYAEALGNRPLHVAVAKHYSERMCRALIHHCADIHAEEQSGLNALEFLVKRVHGRQHPQRRSMLHIADFLRKQGVILRRSDLLLNHVWARDAEACRLLLDARASANDCRSFRYASPLFMAAGKIGDEALTRLFLEYGTDASLRNLGGETAAEVATKEGHAEVASLIQSWLEREQM